MYPSIRSLAGRLAIGRRATNIPAPLVVEPSGLFDGDDGAWSSFVVRTGNPAQDTRVLVSTLASETWVVLDVACNAGPNSNSNCTNSRGGNPSLFDSGASSTWNSQGSWSFAIETNLDISETEGGNYGYDTLGLTTANNGGGVVLNHQVIVGMADNNFWLGNLGLSPRMSNFQPNNSQASFLTSLYNATMIPSLSYSYTAGASYRAHTNASLTLGGYDSSRFADPGVYFPISPDPYRDLVVGVQSISYSDSTGAKQSLLSNGILSLIDSTMTPIWLPQDACNAFSSSFGLQLDSLTQMFTINDTMHAQNIKNNATVEFVIGANIQGGSTVKVDFPYAAFDLNFTNPASTNQNATRYFPIRIASAASQYTLGRTFLQEAVLTADYGRQNFTVAPALPVTSVTHPNIVPILNATATSSSPGAGSSGSSGNTSPGSTGPGGSGSGPSGKSGIGTGAIVGIVVGVIAVAIVALAAWFIMRRKRRQQKGKGSSDSSEIGGQPPMAENARNSGLPSPPPKYPGQSDYFNAESSNLPNPNPKVGEPANVITSAYDTPLSELPSPSSHVPVPSGHTPLLEHQQLPNMQATLASYDFTSDLPELVGSGPEAEMPSGNLDPELPSPDPSHELYSPPAISEAFQAPSPTQTPAELSAQHRAQRSSATIPADSQPHILSEDVPPIPEHAADTIAGHHQSMFSDATADTFVPTPEVGSHAGSEHYFQDENGEGHNGTGLSGGPNILSATSVPITGATGARIISHGSPLARNAEGNNPENRRLQAVVSSGQDMEENT